jgi:heavy metal sensor kinase
VRLKTNSVRIRLTLWHVAVLATIILGFAFGTYFFVRESLLRQIDNHLERDLATVQRVALHGTEELAVLAHHGNVALFRVNENGSLLAATERWDSSGLGDITPGSGTGKSLSIKGADGERYRITSLVLNAAGRELRIDVAHEEQAVRQSLRSLKLILLLGIPAALLLAIAGGYFLAGRALSPIGTMLAKAREITAECLSERLPVENPDDEFGQLAMVFNDTFLRLEDSFERLRRFTADASHELRTPLTAIRSVGEVGMQENIDASSCREVIGSMLEETDRLTRLVDSLLTLSRSDAGSVLFSKEQIDLSALTAEVGDCLHVLAEEKEQTLTITSPSPLHIDADRTTLRQALINLLDNAIKYTPGGGTIKVTVGKTPANEPFIAVNDNGPGIAPEHQNMVYERFYRIDKGRSREVGGAGLGLSIARWAVEANNGRLELESSAGRGCTFRIVLPA